MGSKHQALVKQILVRLGSRRDVRIWESQVGIGRTLDGARTFRYGLVGCSDIVGVLAPYGLILCIEAKVGDDVQLKTQAAFQRMIERMGGIYIIAYSPEEAEELVNARLQQMANHPAQPARRPISFAGEEADG